MERFPIAALVITAVFAMEVTMRSSGDVTFVASDIFWGLALALAPMMQMFSISDVPTAVLFGVIAATLFIVLAFIETTIYIVLRKTTPRTRWTVRATLAAIAIVLLLFTPAAGPMRLF